MYEMGPWLPKYHIFDDQFYLKKVRKLSSMYSSLFILIVILLEEDEIYKKFSSGPRRPIIRTKFTISFEFGPL